MLGIYFNSPEFLRLCRGDREINLARVALEIAGDLWTNLDVDHYLNWIDDTAIRVERHAGPTPEHLLRRLIHVLFEEERLAGNSQRWFDARNSCLNHVIDKRTGIPISLGIVVMAVARRIGLNVSGANLPLHFMVRIDMDGQPPRWIDAFNAGRIHTEKSVVEFISDIGGKDVAVTAAHLSPASDHAVVVRSLNNLKAIHLREGNFAAATRVIARLLALKPGDMDEQRDLGFACFRAGRAREARNWLTPYIEMCPEAIDVREVRAVVDSISSSLA